MTRVVLVGPPGAGKGTQAATLSDKLGVPHISTGDLFRAHIGDGTELGRRVKQFLDDGALVPDELTNELVRERLEEQDAEAGFVLDGFPRNVSQADLLKQILAENDHQLDSVVEIQVDEEQLIRRLMARGRADDTEDVIRYRQRVYRSETAPLLDYYVDILRTVSGIGEVDEVTDRILAALRARA